MLPRWAYLSLGLLMAASVVLAFYQRAREGSRGGYARVLAEQPEPGFAAYVLGYSGGVQGRTAPVRVRFTAPMKGAQPGKPADATLLTLEPRAEGTLVWEDQQTLAFTPKDPLPFGAAYRAAVALDRLMPVEEGFGTFRFSFITPRQGVRIRGLAWTEGGTALEGQLVLADFEKGAAVEEAFSAQAAGTGTPLGKAAWQHSADGRTHTFRIGQVLPVHSGAEAVLSVSEKLPGLAGPYRYKTRLPEAGAFALWNIEEQPGPDRELVLYFTQDLDPEQDLAGMVALEGFAPLRAWAEGSRIRVALPQGAVERGQEEGSGLVDYSYGEKAVVQGQQTLRLGAGLRSRSGKALPQDLRAPIDLEPGKPSVRLAGQGMVLPPSQGKDGRQVFLPFEAIGLRQARVTVYRIGPANALHFLQSINEYGSEGAGFYQQRLGRPAATFVLNLAAAGYADARRWNKYRADLTPWLGGQPGAIHYAQVSFDRTMVDWNCQDKTGGGLMAVSPFGQQEVLPGFDDDGYGRSGDEYGDGGYDYSQEDNPCNPAYYASYSGLHRTSAGQYLVASNLGMTAKKQADGALRLALTNLKTARPEPGAEVLVYSKQLELLGSVQTDAEGFASWKGARAYCVMARKGPDHAYLKVENSQALATAGFDVGGSQTQGGDRAFIYTERGVYRPGDTLHVGTMLEGQVFSRSRRLPQVLELENPADQSVARVVKLTGKDNHARFDIPTAADWPTGVYRLRLRAGGLTETRTVAIEAVKPNRMKVELQPEAQHLLHGYGLQARLAARWLFGAPANGYRYQVEARPLRSPWQPPGFEAYGFEDVTQPHALPEERLTLAEGRLDQSGNARLLLEPHFENLRRPVGLGLTTTVFEPGGDLSTDQARIFLHPFEAYVGIGTGEEEGLFQTYETGKPVRIALVHLSPLSGQPVPAPRLEVQITRLDWRWWWQEEQGSYVYVDNATEKPYRQDRIALHQGRGAYTFTPGTAEWGRYLLRVTNPETGHTASRVLYIGYPSDAETTDSDMLTRVGLTADKRAYKPGETAAISCGKDAAGTRALVSLERGGRVLEQFWAEPAGAQGTLSIPIKAEHGPNAYAFVSLMRPHAESRASRPLRRYGVVNLTVETDAGRLLPRLALPEAARPNSTLALTVSEAKGRPMSYMLMVVDEGLLDLTRFKTPDPYQAFYGRLALEVRTFDMYGQVISAGALEASRLAVTGGDAEARDRQEAAQSKIRFEAVSLMYGPFSLKEGASARHQLLLPEYTGSVRVMAVACGSAGTAFGSAEKAVPVRGELILNGTAPRFLLPGDKTLLGMSVEYMKKGLSQATVSATAEGGALAGGKATVGRNAAFFPVTAGPAGTVRVAATASGGGFISTWRAAIPVHSGTRPVQETELLELKPGQARTLSLAAKGQPGTDRFALEASPSLPFPIRRSLDYLIHYPYGCAEQTLSATVAQMLLPGTVALDAARQAQIARNVAAGLARMAAFRTATGGLSLWPGQTSNDSWVSAYGLHALKLARARGYASGEGALPDLEAFVAGEARAYRYSSIDEAGQLLQAYRLYALAPAATEEMNRLLQAGRLAPQARWLLAAALVQAGRSAPVPEDAGREAGALRQGWEIFHSPERDQAMILLGLNALKAPPATTLPLARQVAARLAENPYPNTQEIVWALLALEPYLGGGAARQGVSVTVAQGGATQTLASPSGAAMLDLKEDGATVTVKNAGKAPCYLTLTHRYEPRPGSQPALSEGLRLEVDYTDGAGNPVSLSGLRQGQSLLARVTVTGLLPGVHMDNLALTWFAPAGFEIRNDRLSAPDDAAAAAFEHQDIRDDKVRWFFPLGGSASKTFTVPVTAAYPGSYTLPSALAEDMYHPERRAATAAGRVEIGKAEGQ